MTLKLNIKDPAVVRHVEGVMAVAQGFRESLRPICGLMDAYDYFRIREGEESPRVREIIGALMSPELREALRDWFRSAGDNINPAALEFREKLNGLAGERLEVFPPPGKDRNSGYGATPAL